MKNRKRMSLYEFYDFLDKFFLERDDLNFKELEVFLVTGFDVELFGIKEKDTNKIIITKNLLKRVSRMTEKIHKDCKYNRKEIGGGKYCAKTGNLIWSSFDFCECDVE